MNILAYSKPALKGRKELSDLEHDFEKVVSGFGGTGLDIE